MKICKDCKYYKDSTLDKRYDTCLYSPEYDIIRGEPINKYCDIERSYVGRCKEHGANYATPS